MWRTFRITKTSGEFGGYVSLPQFFVVVVVVLRPTA